jgi:transcription initiation factor IIE alpha subunit
MESTIEKLYDGVYECPSCDVEYAVERATENDLFCEQCGGDLVESEDDDLDLDGEEDAA